MNMSFSKRFQLGLVMVFVGILTAFNYVSDYRPLPVLIFWLAMLSSLMGVLMMFKGVKPKKNSFK